MKVKYPFAPFRKILVPVVHGHACLKALAAAQAIAGESQIYLVGLVPVPEGDSLSTAPDQARVLRKNLQALAVRPNIHLHRTVRATHNVLLELVDLIDQEGFDLLVLEWPCLVENSQFSLKDLLVHPPCDLVLASGNIPELPEKVLVAMRGGPYAELALRISLAIAQTTQADITALHTVPAGGLLQQDAAYHGIERVLANLPKVNEEIVATDDGLTFILERARECSLIVLGATAKTNLQEDALGPFAQQVLRDSPAGVLVVKTRRPMPQNLGSVFAGQTAISVLVDQWFAQNTYYADEFESIDHLLELKAAQGVRISLALPALNEENTVGEVIRTVKGALQEAKPLLDEIVLIDSNSWDATRAIAADMGIPVYIHQELLPRHGGREGKGEALWKSLYVTHGDLVVWVDTDIANIHPRFVYGLVGPLLLQPEVQFVKGFYRRPLRVGDKIQAGGGGRVTELTARPLLNLFYPELSGFIQPLSGEYGGRRSALEQLSFFSGYGVEIGLLIDMFERYGLHSLAQVDLQERIHHNQSLESLSKMSFAIIQAVIHKIERRYGASILQDINKTMKLIRYEQGRLFLDVEEIAEVDRPPMVELEEYREAIRKTENI